MSDLNTEIEEMAEKMEKSTKEPKELLIETLQEMGPDKLREKIPTLNKSEKEVLFNALEEMKKAVSMDDAYAAPVIEGDIEDTKLQEEIASDDADEKLVKPEAAKHNHQGDVSPEGRDGHVIKGMSDKEEDKKIAEKEAKKEVKEHEKEMHAKKACMTKSEDEEMKEKLIALKKSIEEEVGERATPELVKAEMKKRMLKEEGQLGDAPEMEKEKTRGDKARPEAIKVEEENREAQDKVDDKSQGQEKKMKKSVNWADENELFKSSKGGRNHSFSVGAYYDEAIKKSEEEPKEEVKKSEGEAKEDLNDIIEKGGDASWDDVTTERMIKSNKEKVTGRFYKSFATNEIAEALGLTEEQAKEVLGE